MRKAPPAAAAQHCIVRCYAVHAEYEPEFLAAYCADGAWAALFRRGDGYHGRELRTLPDGRYRSVDRWRSQADWERFRVRHAAACALLDAACAAFILEQEPESP